MLIRVPQGWEIPEREAVSESVYFNRREVLKSAGFLGVSGLLASSSVTAAPPNIFPAKRNPAFTLDRPLTPEFASTGFNNYYEFTIDKEGVKNEVSRFQPFPWKTEISGLVKKPLTIDIDDIFKKMPMEERLIRHRCVEAWSMSVPWTGFPLSALIKLVEPKPEAKFVRFTSVKRPAEMPGIYSQPWYPWPYYEAIRIDEAMNPLSFMVVGMYGKLLPKQNGAPLRIHMPWKYGFKSLKAITKIEFLPAQPATFWNHLQPEEYGFYAPVNPQRPHPRWSQAYEKVIPTMERRPTLKYNGYEQWVAGMYNGQEV